MSINNLPKAAKSANTSLLSKVGLLFAFDMIAGAVGAYCGRGITNGWDIVGLFVASLALLFAIKALEKTNVVLAAFFATFFSFILGVMIAPAIGMYVAHIGWGAVALAFLGTSLAMVVFGGIGAFSGRDFSSWGPFLFLCLLGLIVVRFVFAFLPAMSTLNIISGLGGTILFSGYFIYDFYQASHDDNTWASAVDHSVDIFLDFINFLMSLLEMLDSKS